MKSNSMMNNKEKCIDFRKSVENEEIFNLNVESDIVDFMIHY